MSFCLILFHFVDSASSRVLIRFPKLMQIGFGTQEQGKEKITYKGFWKKNRKDGIGMLYRTGTLHEFIYNGLWKKGKKHVEGIQHYGDGGSYDGEWRKDNRNGSGRMDYRDGSTYIGFWMNDNRSGFGKMWYADGATYEGDWQNDKRDGFGVLITSENNKYEGYWKNGLKHGEGKYFFHEKGVEHSGLWVNDIFCCGFYQVKNPNAPAPMNTEIPQCTQTNAQEVLDKAKEYYKLKM